jgi:Rrf2 family protein
MAINTRFATGVHALLLLAAEPDVLQTSEDVARKLNTNPVVIRRVFSLLQQSDLVESLKGPSGGSRLARSAKEISLADIYRALVPGDVFHIASFHTAPAGKASHALQQTLKDAQKALEKELAQTSLGQLVKKSGKKDKH